VATDADERLPSQDRNSKFQSYGRAAVAPMSSRVKQHYARPGCPQSFHWRDFSVRGRGSRRSLRRQLGKRLGCVVVPSVWIVTGETDDLLHPCVTRIARDSDFGELGVCGGIKRTQTRPSLSTPSCCGSAAAGKRRRLSKQEQSPNSRAPRGLGGELRSPQSAADQQTMPPSTGAAPVRARRRNLCERKGLRVCRSLGGRKCDRLTNFYVSDGERPGIFF
jgi:hypothetical protein